MISSQQYEITTERTLLTIREAMDSIKGQNIVIKNVDNSETVYLGGEDVTTSNGFALAPNTSISFNMEHLQNLYAISTSSVDICILWMNLR